MSAYPVRFTYSLAAMAIWLGSAAISSAAIVQIDFNERPGPGITQSGYSPFLIDAVGGATAIQTGTSTRTFGAVNVSLMDAGGVGYDDRLRTPPANAGAFTQSDLLRDVIFSRNLVNRGLNLRVTGLVPYGIYSGSVWSYDNASTGTRVSDWSSNGITFRNNYTFNGAVLPTTNNDYRMDFLTIASADGEVVVKGRRDALSVNAVVPPASDFGVFLNGFQLDHEDTLVVAPFPSLSVDFGNGTTTLPNFHQFTLGTGGVGSVPSASDMLDALTVTVTGVGVNLQERSRAAPLNDGVFTQESLLRDFIFAESGVAGVTGLDVRVDGLIPNQQYLATIWSYDNGSPGARAATWTSDLGLVNTQFAGEALPRTNDDYRSMLFVSADANGSLLLSGRKSADGIDSPAVFINALQLRAIVPEPSSLVLAAIAIGVFGCVVRRRIK